MEPGAHAQYPAEGELRQGLILTNAAKMYRKHKTVIRKPAVILPVRLRAAIHVELPFTLSAEPIVEQEHPVAPFTRKPLLIAALVPRLLISFARN
tara:strand:- start:17 stop:301 length:285 start_codon:yes stop_codon:yes gene_type:complete